MTQEPVICGNCKKPLTALMEIEYSRHLTEYFCGPECATDFYFSYLESAPVDFSNELPSGVIVNSKKRLMRER